MTLEGLRARLMELHPDVATGVDLYLQSAGYVSCTAYLHPGTDEVVWRIGVSIFDHEDNLSIEKRIAKTIGLVLAKVEAGDWDKGEVSLPSEPTDDLSG